MSRLAGKKVVLSGATGGVGQAACRLFCAEGAQVLGVDIADEPAEQLLAETRAEGGEIDFAKVDVGSVAEVEALAARVGEEWGSFDILVNNAGIILGAPLFETTPEQWDHVHTVTLKSVFLMTTKLGPLLGDGSAIVNVSSAGGLVAFADMAAYGAAKAAVVMFSKCCALDLAPKVRVNAVLPGVIDTQMPRNFVSNLDGVDEIWKGFEEGHLTGRLARPEEIASSLLYLASDESSFMTGAAMVVDGGWSVR